MPKASTRTKTKVTDFGPSLPSGIGKSIDDLSRGVRAMVRLKQFELEWVKGHRELATHKNLREMEHRMAIKLSELKTEVAGIRTQVTKIWGEQQKKYDALVVAFDELKASLDNAELPEDVATELTEFKTELQAFDDTIPDTTA